MPAGTRPAPPDDTVRLVHSGTIAGLPWAMIMWLQVTASSRVAADLSAVLTSISSSYLARFVPRVPALCVLTQLQGVWKTPGGGEIVATNNTTRAGTNVNALLNNVATAVVLDWHIDQYYRGGKPRSYFPGPPGSDCTDSVHLTGTALTNWQTAAAGYLADINALASGGISAVKLGTVSFQRGNAWRVPPVFYPYNSVGVRSVLGIQRRRLLA